MQVADEILVGWTDIVDDDGEQIQFNKAAKAQLLELPMMAACIIETYFTSLVEEKRKN